MASNTEMPTLNKKIGEEKVQPDFVPSEKHLKVVSEVFSLFSDASQRRNKSFEYFDARNLTTYINDSVKRFVTNIDERDSIEDWQARVNAPLTRNKIIAILGKAAQVIPSTEFFHVGTEDIRRTQILTDLKDHADRMDDTEELMFFALLEAAVKGTVVGYEGYEEKVRKIRDIEEFKDGVEITIKEGKKITRRLLGSIIPLENFYPSSVGIRKIPDMPYCFWREEVPESQFRMKFVQYPNAEYVKPFFHVTAEESRPFYLDYISNEVSEGSVEIIRYYNQDTDEFVIIANGVWLNPLEGELIMPLPFKHKKLPFWSAIYEPLGNFFYGKSIADKLKGMQDVLNVLNNMLLDQSFLSIYAPILVSGQDRIEDDFLRPGRRIPVDDPNNYKQLEIKTPSGWHQYILEFTKRIMEETTVDPVASGAAGVGSRVTATEIERAAQGATMVLGLFTNFIKWGVRDKDRLRGANVMQFYNTPLVEQVLGSGGSREMNKAFNTFKIDDTVLTSGKRGTKIIEMYRSKEELPKKATLKAQAKLIEMETKRKVEKIAITPQYIRNFEFDIKLIPNPKTEMSKALNRALTLEKARVYMAIMPDMIDREELAITIAEAFDDDPVKILRKDLLEKPPAVPGPPEVKPEGTVAKQLAAGPTGGQPEGLGLREMAGMQG